MLIVGASVRAAAESARRAGLAVVAADRFADADLALAADVVPLERFPAELLRVGARLECDAWMYTGGIENRPAFVERMTRRLPLWGCGAGLPAVRDPFRLREIVRAAGFEMPEMTRSAAELAIDGRWLRKSYRGSGGMRVAAWAGAGPIDERREYLQRRVTGLPCSAAFVATRGQARLLGASEQLPAPALDGSAPFRYGGSIGPLPLERDLVAALARLGNALAAAFGLVGLFGVDGLLADGRFTVLEVNPRYTASLEVLERADGFAAVALHAAACRDGELPREPLASANGSAWFGKRVVYARHELPISQAASEWLLDARGESRHPKLADIPRANSTVPAEAPLLTVFATGDSRTMVTQRLASEERSVYASLANFGLAAL